MPWNPLDDLSPVQRGQLDTFADEVRRVNKRINLVAPATIPHLEERHLIHSLVLAHRCFPNRATVVDFGAGGGLPTVPLAIRFPEVQFVAIDSVRKKTEAIRLFARTLKLDNLHVWQGRAETWDGAAHYAVSRATAPLSDLWAWFECVFQPLDTVPEDCWPQGLITLKGGNLTDEVNALLDVQPNLNVDHVNLSELLGRPFFRGKEMISVANPKSFPSM